ncbi:glutamine-hydrolyzing GMP synthase, partial [Candidatus Gottesmanbacteria bacterium]|nr:glutamine-hydrolyzing GMP synthase [Candidatus Gottesmanbacteria bacterium]
MILIFDFGSQTTHLIARRIRELSVKAEIVDPKQALGKINKSKPKGIILSGGPAFVYRKNAPSIDKIIFSLDIPILGICYGLHLIAYLLEGKVVSGKKEFGPAQLTILSTNHIFSRLPKKIPVWMSHGDEVTVIPSGFKLLASTPRVKYAAVADCKRKIYGIQFHPEVHHTPLGGKILKNFAFDICQETPSAQKIAFNAIIASLKTTIGKQKVVCALSGGIDSAVAAVLTSKAAGDNLTCFYVDTGLMREGETAEVVNTFREYFKLNLKVIQAEAIFLKNLKGITNPERKREIIGETFIRVFEKEVFHRFVPEERAKFLVQGTIYPDVIESQGTKLADKIKTHHNVAGIPAKHSFTIIEPLRQFYKDEVREIAAQLDFPKQLINRHVFPGPGLAVRIVGEVTNKKLNILKRADAIVTDEIKKAKLYHQVWMAFAVLVGVKTTGVTGD